MNDTLRFNPEKYELKKCTLEGRTITYRAYEDIVYCRKPLDPIQKLNLYVPEEYYNGKEINGYTLNTAPIFAPNTVGGYMPGSADSPGIGHIGNINATFEALEHGYIVACAGVRGRTSGKISEEFFVGGKASEVTSNTGKLVGKAPAFVVDMKAAIRYLRFNKDLIPGDVEKIITNGTSAGGALSALTGASGNEKDYEYALKEIGAVDEKDNIFAASCYCPIHNLENSDSAYEWLFCGIKDYHKIRFRRVDGKVVKTVTEGELNDEEIKVSKELKDLFPKYINSLSLCDEKGNTLSLNDDGTGSFLEYVKSFIITSANDELSNHTTSKNLNYLAVEGSEVEKQPYLIMSDNKVIDIDWDKFTHTITRMKPAPSFDSLYLSSPENDEFGTEDVPSKHFTEYAFKNSKVNGQIADKDIIKMMNPLSYIGCEGTAKYWRIRHGVYDRDTSLAIPVILYNILKTKGYSVDFALPWGLPHSGDYDLKELFEWIDNICKK